MRTLIAAVLALAALPAMAAVQEQEVIYEADGESLHGVVYWNDSQQSKRPGVLVVHEWWGLNEYARERAEMLARMGYVAMAVDMYGEGKVAEHPKQAGEFSKASNSDPEGQLERFQAARKALMGHPASNREDIAAIGYCFGGGVVLNMARAGVDLDGVASFHGSLKGNREAGDDLQAAVFAATGGADQFVPAEQVAGFVQEMHNAGADLTLMVLPGAKHSFTVPSADEKAEQFNMPIAYDKQADERSWAELEEFLARVFAD